MTPTEPAPDDTDAVWRTVRSHDGTPLAWRVDRPTTAPAPDERPPTIVLCNGIACDDGYWRDVWRPLSAHAPVVRWHYRAHGRSGAPANPEEVYVSSVVRDLQAVLDAAGADRAVLVGHSFGVQVIYEMVRAAPERVAGLVAVAGAAGHPLGTILGRNTGALVFPLLEMALWPAPRLASGVLRAGLRSPVAYWAGRAIGGIGSGAPREVMERYFAHVADRDIAVLLRMFRAMQEHSSEDVLPDISVPTRIVAGTADGMTPRRHARRMAAAIPGAQLVEVDGATHVLPIEHPDVVVREVLEVVTAGSGGAVRESS